MEGNLQMGGQPPGARHGRNKRTLRGDSMHLMARAPHDTHDAPAVAMCTGLGPSVTSTAPAGASLPARGHYHAGRRHYHASRRHYHASRRLLQKYDHPGAWCNACHLEHSAMHGAIYRAIYRAIYQATYSVCMASLHTRHPWYAWMQGGPNLEARATACCDSSWWMGWWWWWW